LQLREEIADLNKKHDLLASGRCTQILEKKISNLQAKHNTEGLLTSYFQNNVVSTEEPKEKEKKTPFFEGSKQFKEELQRRLKLRPIDKEEEDIYLSDETT